MIKVGTQEGSTYFIYDENYNKVPISSEEFKKDYESYIIHILNEDSKSSVLIFDVPDNSLSVSLSEKIAELAHEVNNPLAIVNSSLKVLEKIISKEELKNPELIQENFSDIRDSIQRIKSIFVQTRSEIEQGEISFHKVTLIEIISSIKSNFSLLFNETDIDFKISFDKKIEEIELEVIGTTLLQCLFNLINNAYFEIKKQEGKKSIELNITKINDQLHFSVIDNGRGIPATKEEKVFELNYSTKGSEGSGIGLYLVKKYIEMNNGEINLDRNYKDGAKLDFYIPLLDSERTQKTILVVDDEVEVLDLIKFNIGKNYNILIAQDGNAAFNLLKNNHVDAIISDYKMPKVTGIDFYHMVRAINTTVPFILFSGYIEADVKSYENSENHFFAVSKPNFDNIFEILSKSLRPVTKAA